MDEVTHEEVFSVYGRVLEAFARQGLRCEIIGGQALMQLGFTTWTKDLDLAVPPPALPQCLQVLETINWRGQGFNYRPVGAPLADPWMAGGWSAHLEMPLGVPFSPRVDLLTQLPRLAADWHLRPFTLADLATSKKTQRTDKDWTMVTLLGVRLLGEGDAAGLWNIFDAPALLQAVSLRPDLAAHVRRPAVQLALQGCAEDALSAALEAERRMWVSLDRLRFRIFSDANRAYSVKARAWLEAAPVRCLREQHAGLVELAKTELDPFPLQSYGLPRWLADSRRSASIGLDPGYLRFFPGDEQLLQSATAVPTMPDSTSANSRGKPSPASEDS
jgi:hypothetical protein